MHSKNFQVYYRTYLRTTVSRIAYSRVGSRFSPKISRTFSTLFRNKEKLLRTCCSPYFCNEFVTMWLKYVSLVRRSLCNAGTRRKHRFLFSSHSWTMASSASDKRLEENFLRLWVGGFSTKSHATQRWFLSPSLITQHVSASEFPGEASILVRSIPDTDKSVSSSLHVLKTVTKCDLTLDTSSDSSLQSYDFFQFTDSKIWGLGKNRRVSKIISKFSSAL